MNTIISWCPGKSPCDPCKPVTKPTPTTPGGWYCVIHQVVYLTYFGGPGVILATIYVGPNGYTSGEYNLTNPYPDGLMQYLAYERNIAYDINPYYSGYGLGAFSDPANAMAACQATLANAH